MLFPHHYFIICMTERSFNIILFFCTDIDDKFKYTPRDNYFYSSKRQAWANCAAPDGQPRPAVTFINGTSGKPINTGDPRVKISMLSRGAVLYYQMVVNDATEAEVSNKWACRASNKAGQKFSTFKVEYFSKLFCLFQ